MKDEILKIVKLMKLKKIKDLAGRKLIKREMGQVSCLIIKPAFMPNVCMCLEV